MVKGDDSCLKVVGSNPGAIYWMYIFQIAVLKKLYCLFEKTENKLKRDQGWPIFIKNNISLEFWQDCKMGDPFKILPVHSGGLLQRD